MSGIRLKNQLLSLFYEGNQVFLERDLDNILSDVSERNLCHLLANHIDNLLNSYELGEYFVDTEYNRNGGFIKTIINRQMKVVPVTCDLIIHSRGHMQKDNLLALEMKKLPCSNEELDKDRDRLLALTKHDFGETFSLNNNTFPKNVCDYEVGIYYLIDIERRMITLEIYNDGQKVNSETQSFDYYKEFKK